MINLNPKIEEDAGWLIVTANRKRNTWTTVEMLGTVSDVEKQEDLKKFGVDDHDDRIYIIAKARQLAEKALTNENKESMVKRIKQDVWEKNTNSLSMMVLEKIAQNLKREATEIMVSEVLKEKHIYTVRHDENAEMWIYFEGIYVPEARTYIREFCRKVLGDAYTTHLANETISKIEADTYIGEEEFFKNDNIEEIILENGILNIFTLSLKPHTPEKIFFNKLPVKYDASKTCPAIHTHLETVLKNPEDKPVVFELAGYLLLKEYPLEKAFMLSGDGRNGKSKTIELLKRFVGAENCCSIPLQEFEKNDFVLSELFNKLANISGEIDSRTLKFTGKFKSLTGGDQLNAHRKFLPDIKFVNYAKQIYLTNQLPKTMDTSSAFWNRWVLLDFPWTFLSQKELDALSEPEKAKCKLKDPEIIKKLATEDELSGLLNEALAGLKRVLEQRDFSYSKSNAEVREMWIRKSDSLTAFLNDCVEEAFEQKIPKHELKTAYNTYCSTNKAKIATDKELREMLESTLGAYEARGDEKDEGRRRNWVGIKFKEGYTAFVQPVQPVRSNSPYTENSKFPIGVKTTDKLDTLDKTLKDYSEEDKKPEPIIPNREVVQ